MTREAHSEKRETTPFLSDIHALRERARRHIERGAVGTSYVGDVEQTIEILQTVLATELVCVLRYTQHSIAATGLAREGVAEEFAQHAKEEMEHALSVAKRINQLGGDPDLDPKGLATKSASQYVISSDLATMIRENLVAERIAIDHYRELIRYFADDDPTTRSMLESILAVEEEHASDMLDLLAIHGKKS